MNQRIAQKNYRDIILNIKRKKKKETKMKLRRRRKPQLKWKTRDRINTNQWNGYNRKMNPIKDEQGKNKKGYNTEEFTRKYKKRKE